MSKNCKKVFKYDCNWNKILEYDSVNECVKELKVSPSTLSNISKYKKTKDGFYYIIQPYHPTYKIVKCANCENPVKVFKSRYENREKIFCSKICESDYKIKHPHLNAVCSFCGKPIHKKESQINRSNRLYCSKECLIQDKRGIMSGSNNHQFGLKGSLNSSWISDERISFYGYKLIRDLKHPFRNNDDFVFEHRLVAEKYLLNNENSIKIDEKFYLKLEYVVHHLDFNRQNNSLENLLVMKRSNHTSLHVNMRTEQDFKTYCDDYHVSFDLVMKNHNYNIEHYNYKKIA
ncbi:hypothetical protein HMPREF1215_00863 [Coprococcus sp. HPP0074]|nr:hypothetical protein HMPREF1215_00863 [Coprococcus sp. HPP0074]